METAMYCAGGVPARDGAGQFTSTNWSAVLAAGESGSPQATAALDQLFSTYWFPVYCYALRQGHSPENAEDPSRRPVPHPAMSDVTLRRKVEELLKEHFSNDSLLAGSALAEERTTEVESPAQESPAQVLGRCKLLEKVGEGGFGEVWMAEQREPVKRRVARKIIKLGMDIQWHLANEPVVARPPSVAYRLQKEWQRNEVVFTAGAVVAVALIAGIGVSTWQTILATQTTKGEFQQGIAAQTAQPKAETEQQRADAQARKAAESEQRSRRLLYVSDMNLAQQSLKLNNGGRARRLLDQHRPQPGEEAVNASRQSARRRRTAQRKDCRSPIRGGVLGDRKAPWTALILYRFPQRAFSKHQFSPQRYFKTRGVIGPRKMPWIGDTTNQAPVAPENKTKKPMKVTP